MKSNESTPLNPGNIMRTPVEFEKMHAYPSAVA